MFDSQYPRILGTGIDLYPPADDPIPKINLDQTPILTSPTTLNARSIRAHIAMGAESPGVDAISQKLSQDGGEDSLRQQAAANEDIQGLNVKRDILNQLISSGAPLDQWAQSLILGLGGTHETDPGTVLENGYARNLTNYFTSQNHTAGVYDQIKADPEAAHQELDAVQKHIAIQEVIRKRFEDAQQEYQGTNVFQKGLYLAESMIPFAHWGALHSEGMGFGEGTNIFNKTLDIYRSVSPSEAAAKVDAYLAEMHQRQANPSEILEFLDNALTGPSEHNKFMGNISTGLDIFSLPGAGTISKVLLGGSLGLAMGLRAELRGAKAIKAATAASKKIPDVMTREVDEAAGHIAEGNIPFHGEVDQNVYTLRRQLSDVITANSSKNPSAAEILDAGGDTRSAAKLRAAENVDNILLNPGQDIQTQNMKMMSDYLPTLMNPDRFLSDVGNLSAEASRRLFVQASRTAEMVRNAVNSALQVQRLPTAAEFVAQTEAEQYGRGLYDTANSAVLDVKQITPDMNPATNTGYAEFSIGLPNGEYFPTKSQAHVFAKETLGLKDQYIVEPESNRWAVKVRKDYNETTEGVRDARISTDNTTPMSSGASILRRFWMGAKEQLSPFQIEQRTTALRSSQALQAWIKQIGQYASRTNLSNKEFKSLNRILELNRDTPNPLNPDKPGFWHETINDLQQAYMDTHKRLPTPAEVQGYFAVRQVYETEYLLNNFGIYRDKSILGYSTWNLARRFAEPMTGEVDQAADFTRQGFVPHNEGDQTVYKHQNFSFDAKEVPSIPWSDNKAGQIVVYKDKANPETYIPGKIDEADIKKLEALKSQGYRYLHVYGVGDKDVAEGFGVTGPVNYVITKDARYQPLSWQQFPSQPGGHVKYNSPFYLKQPVVIHGARGVWYHGGDLSVFSAETRAKANRLGQDMEKARELYNAKDFQGLQRHVEKRLPLEWSGDTLKAKFDNGTLNPDVPFAVTYQGKNTSDASTRLINGKSLQEHFPGIRDTMNSPYNDKGKVDAKFTSEKDFKLDAVKNSGTEANPIYNLTSPPLVDPLKTMQEAMRDIIRNRYFKDYQITAAESFVREFATELQGPGGSPISKKTDPMAVLQNATIPLTADNWSRQVAARIVRGNIQHLMGQPTAVQKLIDGFKLSMKESVYNTLGEKYSRYMTNSELSWVKDPFSWMRGVAFHTKLGFFNPIQIFVQGQTLANIVAISPRAGAKAWLPSIQMRRLALTSQQSVVDHIAGLADHPTMGMSKAQFLESRRWLKESGYDIVGREYAWRADHYEDGLFKSKTQQILNVGDLFFTGTERFVRINAWNTSYLEYIEKTGLEGRLRPRDIQKIQARADDMTGNMTADANAFWQRSIGSNLTQFFGYNARISDLMLGTRLNTEEKARLLTMFGALYGLPVMLNSGVPMGLIPIYQNLREEAISNGKDINDQSWRSVLYNGIPATAYAMITGQTPNFGERYGPAGNTYLTDLLSGKTIKPGQSVMQNVLHSFFGASGSILGDVFKSGYPALMDFINLLNPTSEGSIKGKAMVLAGDIAQMAKEISTVNTFAKTYVGVNYGVWESKNDKNMVDGIDPGSAMFYGLTGQQPQDLSDAFLKSDISNDWDQFKKDTGDRMITLMRGYLSAKDSGDEDTALVYDAKIQGMIALTRMTPPEAEAILMKAYSTDTVVQKIINKFIQSGTTEQQQRRQELELLEEQRKSQ